MDTPALEGGAYQARHGVQGVGRHARRVSRRRSARRERPGLELRMSPDLIALVTSRIDGTHHLPLRLSHRRNALAHPWARGLRRERARGRAGRPPHPSHAPGLSRLRPRGLGRVRPSPPWRSTPRTRSRWRRWYAYRWRRASRSCSPSAPACGASSARRAGRRARPVSPPSPAPPRQTRRDRSRSPGDLLYLPVILATLRPHAYALPADARPRARALRRRGRCRRLHGQGLAGRCHAGRRPGVHGALPSPRPLADLEDAPARPRPSTPSPPAIAYGMFARAQSAALLVTGHRDNLVDRDHADRLCGVVTSDQSFVGARRHNHRRHRPQHRPSRSSTGRRARGSCAALRQPTGSPSTMTTAGGSASSMSTARDPSVVVPRRFAWGWSMNWGQPAHVGARDALCGCGRGVCGADRGALPIRPSRRARGSRELGRASRPIQQHAPALANAEQVVEGKEPQRARDRAGRDNKKHLRPHAARELRTAETKGVVHHRKRRGQRKGDAHLRPHGATRLAPIGPEGQERGVGASASAAWLTC